MHYRTAIDEYQPAYRLHGGDSSTTGAAENSQIRTFDQASISAEGSNPNDADSRGQHSGRIEIIENSQIFCA